MINWCHLISYSFTNGIRIFMCLLTVAVLLKLPKIKKSMAWLSLMFGVIMALLYLFPIPQTIIKALELILILIILFFQYHCDLRLGAFLSFFFEIAVALWDVIISLGLAILFRSGAMINSMTNEYIIAVWIVRLMMIGFAILIRRQGEKIEKKINRFVSIIALLGMLCVLMLTEQSIVPLSDDQLMTWVILSVILLMSVLFYKINRQYEMEKEIVQLKTEQADLLECDYQNLNKIYSANAKLYHDLNNHLEVLYSYILQGQNDRVLHYIEDLRTPVKEITQRIWTGDEAVDYLISSKIAIAEQSGIETKINIEFPRHTNIKSADLTAILGNLLDNALEAAVSPSKSLGFLNLTIRRINDIIIIKVENSYTEKPTINGIEIKTKKADNDLHGWGLKSVRATAERYDGTLEISCPNKTFYAVVTLFFDAI